MPGLSRTGASKRRISRALPASLVPSTTLLERADASNTTPLMHACEQGRLEVVQWLLEQGAAPNAAAAQLAKSQGHADVVKLVKKALKAHKR